MTQFHLKYLAAGTIVGYESQPMALMALLELFPSGVAKNPDGQVVTPQTHDWPVHDGLIFTFWETPEAVDNPDAVYAQLVAI